MLSPEDVQAALDKLGCDIQVTLYETSTATSQEAADSIGTELGSIVKSLCFLVGGQPVVVLAAGDQRMDERKIGQLYEVSKKKVRMADAEKTVELTGYAPGGVPPVGHTQELPILIDKTLERFDLVYAAAGASNAIFPIKLEQLIEITGGKVTDIARESNPGVSL